jgi:hypothetical protein
MSDLLLRALAPGAVVFATALAVVFGDLGVAVLVLAASALLGAIAALWTSLQALSGNVPMTIDEAITLANADAVDERKREILQTLKDLDLDFGVGKIGQEDYDALVARCRREAKGLLRAGDEVSASIRATASTYLTEQSRPGRATRAVCAKCHATNDHDAIFCKKCGGRLADRHEATSDGSP